MGMIGSKWFGDRSGFLVNSQLNPRLNPSHGNPPGQTKKGETLIVGGAWSLTDNQNAVLSNSNKTAKGGTTNVSAGVRSVQGHMGANNGGKWYVEQKCDVLGNGANAPFLVIVNGSVNLSTFISDRNQATHWGEFPASPPTNGIFIVDGVNGGQFFNSLAPFAVNDVMMFAFDFNPGARKAWMGKNGTWLNSGNPAAGTGQCTGVNSIVATTPMFLCAGLTKDAGGSLYDQVTTRFTRADCTLTVPSGFLCWDGT